MLNPDVQTEEEPKKKKELKKNSSLKTIVSHITGIMVNKKCIDISVLDLEKINSYLSIFIIATVNTDVQGRAVAKEIDKSLKNLKIGKNQATKDSSVQNSGWYLLDYGDILVHIMTPEIRHYYDLDKLWGDSKKIKWE